MTGVQTEAVTRVRGTAAPDPYSDEPDAIDWTDAVQTPMRTLAPAQPVTSAETVSVGRDSVTAGFTLYLDPAADVLHTDRMVVRGQTHEVDGIPDLRPGFALVVVTRTVRG